jgi:dihydroxyacetone kinase-like protein
MNSPGLKLLIEEAMLELEKSREELRELDAAIGDGDLGITVGDGAVAIRRDLQGTDDDISIAGVLRSCARSFANANPSTMSALVAAGLLAAAKALGDVSEIDRASTVSMVSVVAETIQSRGGATLGDKTILDALLPSVDALREAKGSDVDALREMINAAETGVVETTGLQSQRGRAAWVGERTVGHADGGATAYLRLLEALLLAFDGSSGDD